MKKNENSQGSEVFFNNGYSTSKYLLSVVSLFIVYSIHQLQTCKK
jgi:hypothetical protein